MEDVAKHASVSIATVSRVLNSPDLVNKETLDRVQGAIKELNYQINITARNLRTQRTHNIAVVVPQLNDPLITNVLSSLEKTALSYGYTTQICVTYGEVERAQKYTRLLAEQRRIDGAFTLAPTLTPDMAELIETVSENTPILLGNHAMLVSPPVPSILFNYEVAAYQATHYLIEHRRSHIALINLPTENCYPAKMRSDGYKRALNEAKINKKLIFEAESTDDYNADWQQPIVSALNAKADAIIAYDDSAAMQVYEMCAALNLKIPDDIAVIGCGNVAMSQYLNPSLTTFELPTEKMGEQAFETLLHYMNGEATLPIEPISLPATFIQRLSAC